jgi:pimeloyl-ACP methyl ester carboxylesterase
MILAGHSGAGALLPAIARRAGRPVAGFVFVDAGLPLDGKTRLEEMGESSPEFAERFRAHTEAGGKFPEWSDEDLRPYIPDDHLRRLMVGELHPRPLDFFDEPIPSEFDWAAHPVGYVLFSASYEPAAAEARRRGWPVRVFDAGHFHMLVDPVGVADTLIALCREW